MYCENDTTSGEFILTTGIISPLAMHDGDEFAYDGHSSVVSMDKEDKTEDLSSQFTLPPLPYRRTEKELTSSTFEFENVNYHSINREQDPVKYKENNSTSIIKLFDLKINLKSLEKNLFKLLLFRSPGSDCITILKNKTPNF